MAVKVTKVTDAGGDHLLVEGQADGYEADDGTPLTLTAHGWVSAMVNHYEANDYDPDGNLRDGAVPRAMTDDEQHAYWERLLTEQFPPPPAETHAVLFQAPDETGAT